VSAAPKSEPAMTALAKIRSHVQDSISTKQALLDDTNLQLQIERLAVACVRSLKGGGKVIFAGNGGSFADAQHFSAEFTSRLLFDRAPLASIVLGANSSSMSAIGNDYGYEQVFARELQVVAAAGDVFIPITTSGNSPNILAAVAVGNSLGLVIVGLTGRAGGLLSALCECIHAPSTETARIQECHGLIGHIICGLVEEEYFPHISVT
jgi:D-sedoheptulose 7-phosphate isomerase